MSKVYLLCGVAGSGKSWIANQVDHLIHYHPSDTLGKSDPTKTMELHDRTVHISTTIDAWRKAGHEVIPLFVMGNYKTVEDQILSRGGKITRNLPKRWSRMERLAKRYKAFIGSSSEILEFLKDELKARDKSHIIYKVTSPSNKVYIGKTCQGLEKRKFDHIHDGRYDSPFSRAITKYGDLLKWEILEEVIGLEESNRKEKEWIVKCNSISPNGYNLTEGGDGGCKSPEAELKRIKAVTKAWENPELRKQSTDRANKMWLEKRDEISALIKVSRSTPESRALTSKRSLETYSNPESRKKLGDAVRKRYEDPAERAKSSAGSRKATARKFEGFKDGIKIGEWENKIAAAKELGIHYTGISNVLRGYMKQSKGYVFKYSDSKDLESIPPSEE